MKKTVLVFVIYIVYGISAHAQQKGVLTILNVPNWVNRFDISIYSNSLTPRDIFSSTRIAAGGGYGLGNFRDERRGTVKCDVYDDELLLRAYYNNKQIETARWTSTGSYFIMFYTGSGTKSAWYLWNVSFKNGSATIDWNKMHTHEEIFSTPNQRR